MSQHVHPRYEESPIIMVRAEPDAVDNSVAGLLVVIALALPAALFAIIQADGYFQEAKDLRTALAALETKQQQDVNGNPVVTYLRTHPIKYQDRLLKDFPPIRIPDYLRKNYRLPQQMY